ncbi:AMP-binding protein [Bradyrhizobium sp.]|uniref:class I adenylate-forming enzyme family protein n=1 Tax=Bradyrhizobium sp. TaxID=376 RepID=UPI0023988942|nr:AMP-binding protein [Bradyrhizobium sp.]MDE2378759.1 AMP-binding protein [Bradyrhizobium sp.]
MNISRWIDKHAKFAPGGAALRFAGSSISYQSLAAEVENAARKLVALGVMSGDVVVYLGLNGPQLLELLFACGRLGASVAPLNWRLTALEHERMLQDCRPRVAVVADQFVSHAAPLRATFEATHWTTLGGPAAGWLSWNDVHASPAALPDPPDADNTPVLLCYTSGSTGAPKGVVHTHASLFWNAINSVHMHDLTSADRVLTTLPLFHVGGLNILTTPALYAGASVTLHPKFDPDDAIDAIEKERITLTVLVPAQLMAMMACPRWQQADLSSLRVVTTGSTIIPASFVQKVHERGLRLIQVYGSTETCPIAAYQRADSAERKLGAAGLPALHCDLRIVDADGRDVSRGEDGEILVRGPNLMREYLNAPEATSASLKDGWYRTGDVGHFDEDGYLFVVSRKNDMIISGGENVYPAEIENVLLEWPAISEVCVFGRPNSRWGEMIVAMIVPAPGEKLTAADVLARLEGRVARYKHPREIVFAAALPRNALGKVIKERVRAEAAPPPERILEGQRP